MRRKPHGIPASLQGLQSIRTKVQEGPIHCLQHPSDLEPRGVESRGRGAAQASRLGVRPLAQDPSLPQGASLPGSVPLGSGLDDPIEYLFDMSPYLTSVEIVPASQRTELQGYFLRELARFDLLSPSPGSVLSGAIMPNADYGRARAQRRDAAGSRPVLRPGNEVFLASLLEEVDKPLDLSLGFEAHRDATVAAAPELLPPAMQATGLLGEIAVEVAHEL